MAWLLQLGCLIMVALPWGAIISRLCCQGATPAGPWGHRNPSRVHYLVGMHRATERDIDAHRDAVQLLRRERPDDLAHGITPDDFIVACGTLWWETPSSFLMVFVPGSPVRHARWVTPDQMHPDELAGVERLQDLVRRYARAFRLEFAQFGYAALDHLDVEDMGIMVAAGIVPGDDVPCIAVLLPDGQRVHDASAWVHDEDRGWMPLGPDVIVAAIQSGVPLHGDGLGGGDGGMGGLSGRASQRARG